MGALKIIVLLVVASAALILSTQAAVVMNKELSAKLMELRSRYKRSEDGPTDMSEDCFGNCLDMFWDEDQKDGDQWQMRGAYDLCVCLCNFKIQCDNGIRLYGPWLPFQEQKK